ncbi:MAG: toxin-antitoxin system HicB family antitoxin [Firmicutes bacterium]|nr:toxin-antitoxin system HicB family antitoxin [Bacillota bacterium]
MKKLTIRLDDEVHRRLKIAAAERGTSIQRIAHRVLLEELARHEQGRPPRRLQRSPRR